MYVTELPTGQVSQPATGWGRKSRPITKVLPLHRIPYKLDDIEDFDANFLLASLSGESAFALLAGRNKNLGPCILRLLQPEVRDGCGEFLVGHFYVTASATAEGIFAGVFHFREFDIWNGLDDTPGRVVDAAVAAQVARIMICYGTGIAVQRDRFGIYEFFQQFDGVDDFES